MIAPFRFLLIYLTSTSHLEAHVSREAAAHLASCFYMLLQPSMYIHVWMDMQCVCEAGFVQSMESINAIKSCLFIDKALKIQYDY